MKRRHITDFQNRVYRLVSRIPRGRVSTYQSVAKCVGCGSCRAVGQALKRNPFAPRVPCHRVIGADLRPGGFQGRRAGRAIRRKLEMLAREGVHFKDGKLVDAGRVYRFPTDRRCRARVFRTCIV